ncbi:MAG: hypothetical protein H6825_10200 [Planctomycetes bacterium]|nr:hypothetical protein [Planctomycetota bacterium]
MDARFAIPAGLVALVFLGACSDAPPDDPRIADDHAVWEVVLRSSLDEARPRPMFSAWDDALPVEELYVAARRPGVEVDGETFAGSPPIEAATDGREWLLERLPGLEPAVLDDFVARNEAPWSLDPRRIHLPVPVVTGPDPLDIPDAQGGIEAWAEQHRTPCLCWVSAVGYDAERTRALVAYATWQDRDAAGGSFALLVRDGDVWTIAQRCDVWIS